jgi:hypothetical protein
MEDLCGSVFIRFPLFLCVLCAWAVKNSFPASEGLARMQYRKPQSHPHKSTPKYVSGRIKKLAHGTHQFIQSDPARYARGSDILS